MPRRKDDVITFKAEPALREAMRGVANRSEFIRDAVLAALENVCPLCMGTGILTPRQRKHWESFARTHRLVECGDCHEMHLTCARDPAAGGAARAKGKRRCPRPRP